MTTDAFPGDDRGLSRLVGYMLTVGITMVLVTGLFVSGGILVADQNEATRHSQMEVVGQQIGSSLESSDRLVRSTAENSTSLVVSRQFPTSLAQSAYSVEITSDRIILREDSGDVSVSVSYRTKTNVRPTTLRGGTIEIAYDPDSDELKVSND